MPNEKSGGVLVFKTEAGVRKYLILHYEEGHWDFPKGHLEGNETSKEAAVRECQEETGITKLEFVYGFEVKIHYTYTRDSKQWKKEVTFFLAQVDGSEPVRISHEHIGFEWLNSKDAIERVTFQNAKELIFKSENFLNKL